MTYKDIYEQFLVTTGIDKNKIADYKPALGPNNSIIVYLKDGNRLNYIADVMVKGYAYFKDERKEREVITEYELLNTGAIKFKTKSGEYLYYISIENLIADERLVGRCEIHQFGQLEEEITTYKGVFENGTKRTTMITPCDIEMIELWCQSKIIKSCSRKYY